MLGGRINRRRMMAMAAVTLLAGCQVVPRVEPQPRPTPSPSATGLPSDQGRHRVALLVPLSGPNSDVGQAIANAATMALLDTSADSIRITTYDTATGADSAAARALSDGNKLILGPLMSDDVTPVLARARPAGVPIITFSNDSSVAARDVFVMGISPDASIAQTVDYAAKRSSRKFAILVPAGDYGVRAEAAYRSAVSRSGGTIVARDTYDRGNTSIISAAQRLKKKGGFDTILLAESARLSIQAAGAVRAAGAATPQLLGTELWSGDASIASSAALRGALFSSVSDGRFGQFAESYRSRFGTAPHRIATLGYDAVLLTIRLARNWKPGTTLPTERLVQSDAFLGVDGAFRFRSNGVIERAMEVRQVGKGRIDVVSPAPAKFDD
ncbi:MAG: penicillin-binding protein activator [Candidatus Andeanibacterium colombiense]|uniref:Penicillin-binding protein activator n=1 Tax=Candidatus Andeanibacterium colombiense TaxID=3121345 RepID=A0AAJ6BNF8_9SPHN|nr:MAG: penicillin-binding protein activator [Sphingomonadaceae bacterium]